VVAGGTTNSVGGQTPPHPMIVIEVISTVVMIRNALQFFEQSSTTLPSSAQMMH
jgi:hypothetical protein